VAAAPEIHVVQVPIRDTGALEDALSAVHTWAPVEIPRGQRPTPIVLAVLGVLAGLGAMALGAVAVFLASPAPDESQTGVEPGALSLLAKPSTERIPFRGSGGRLVLAVGTGGRAAIVLRGLEPAVAGKPYFAWIVTPGAAPVRSARFVGTERAVFLSQPLGRRASVVVSTDRPAASHSGRPQLIAARG
jgi:hypothetical protein